MATLAICMRLRGETRTFADNVHGNQLHSARHPLATVGLALGPFCSSRATSFSLNLAFAAKAKLDPAFS